MVGDVTLTQTAMEGGGFYNKHSSAQAAGIEQMLALLEMAANEVTVGDETLVIADYGASQGCNSMAPMRVAIQTLRARYGAAKPAMVFHTDLPSNDFTSLFKALQDDPNSYLTGFTGVFSAAVGTLVLRNHPAARAGASRLELLGGALAESKVRGRA